MQSSVLTLILTLVAALSGCVTYTKETQDIRDQYQFRQYQQALETLDKSDLAKSGTNRLLYQLERASILDRMNDAKQSRKHFMQADRFIDELKTVSVSQTAASFVYNDSAMDYSGEDYEKVAIHTMLALSFLETRETPQARIEARRINTRLEEINQSYEEGKNRYSEDAFARYLAGTIYESKGEYDSALIDYKKALQLYKSSYGHFYFGGVQKQLILSLYRLSNFRNRKADAQKLQKDFPQAFENIPAEMLNYDQFRRVNGELIVIHEVGNINVKTAEEFVFPFGSQVIRISFPVIERGSKSISKTGVEIKNKNMFIASENFQDMNGIAQWCLEDRRGRLILKTGARLLAKGQVVEQARQNLGILGAVAANIYTATTETADTRSWQLLPARFEVTRIALVPGDYTIATYNNGKLNEEKTVKITAGSIQFLRDKR